MNRLMLSNEDTAPMRTRYTVWKRSESYAGFVHVGNYCTLAEALWQAQNMTLCGYITTVGEKP